MSSEPAALRIGSTWIEPEPRPARRKSQSWAERWAALSEEDREWDRRQAARSGCTINEETGERAVPTLRRGKEVLVHPDHWRCAAQNGNHAAREYCQEHGIPWKLDSGRWRVWLAGVRRDIGDTAREPQPAARRYDLEKE